MNYLDYTKKQLIDEVTNLHEQVAKLRKKEDEIKGAEDALHESEERAQMFFESAPDAYYLYDLTGKFIDGNKVAEELTGYDRHELIGQSFLKLKMLSKDQVPKAAKLLVENIRGKSTGPDELVLTRKDGSQIAMVRLPSSTKRAVKYWNIKKKKS